LLLNHLLDLAVWHNETRIRGLAVPQVVPTPEHGESKAQVKVDLHGFGVAG